MTLDGKEYKDPEEPITANETQGHTVEDGSELALSSNDVSSRSKHKQTFPLRVRKNQTFQKGPECSSIQSSTVNKNASIGDSTA